MIAPGNFRIRFCDCSTTELIRVAADTGVEPVTHRVEVTRSLATGAVTNAIFGDQAARVGIGQASFSWTIGDSLSPCLCGWREVSRAFATEDVAAPGKSRARILPLRREDETADGFEPSHLFRLTQKYPHTAPLELFPFNARGNDRDAEWVVSQTKDPHPSPPVTMKERLKPQMIAGFRRGPALLRFCDDRKRPAGSEREVMRQISLHSELGFEGHRFFLCSQYSATGHF
jgi:hypothetical protein